MIIIDIKNGNIELALKQYKRKVQNIKQVEQLREKVGNTVIRGYSNNHFYIQDFLLKD